MSRRAKAGTCRRYFGTCGGSGQIGGLLIVWEPARCPEMMEFGDGSDVLHIRAQKYAGKVVGKTPRIGNPAAVFLKEEFVLQHDSDSVYVWILHDVLKLPFSHRRDFPDQTKAMPLKVPVPYDQPSIPFPLPVTTNLVCVSYDLTSTQLPVSKLVPS